MAEVQATDQESFDSLLRRFNKKVQQDGILSELRRREHYEKPSAQRNKQRAARKRVGSRSRASRR